MLELLARFAKGLFTTGASRGEEIEKISDFNTQPLDNAIDQHRGDVSKPQDPFTLEVALRVDMVSLKIMIIQLVLELRKKEKIK